MKKKGLQFLLTCCVCATLALGTVACQEEQTKNFFDDGRDSQLQTSKGLEFALNSDDKSYKVIGIGACTDTEIIIPSKYQDFPVTSIGECAFIFCESLTSVVISDNITGIENKAFAYCSNLASVVIGNDVRSIGNGAFSLCHGLTSVVIPDNVTSIDEDAFFYCDNLMSVKIGNGVTSIGRLAFSSCSSLTKIVIPDNVMSVGSHAFSDCSSLTIYCEAENQPSGWNSDWNYSNRPVVWGYTGEE